MNVIRLCSRLSKIMSSLIYIIQGKDNQCRPVYRPDALPGKVPLQTVVISITGGLD
jgi:hypothetical protein